MRIGIVTDIHGDDAALRYALDVLSAERADKIVSLGDVVGKSGDVHACIDMLVKADAEMVRGNHDKLGLDSLHREYSAILRNRMRNTIRIDDLLFSHTATHTDAMYGRGIWKDDRIDCPQKVRSQFDAEPFDVFFFGHVHVPMLFGYDGKELIQHDAVAPSTFKLIPGTRYVCNPGPITSVKDIEIENPNRKRPNAPPSFALYDVATRELAYHPVVRRG